MKAKNSRSSEQQDQALIENKRNFNSFKISHSFQKYQQIMNSTENCEKWKKKLLQDGQIYWDEIFREEIQAKILQTDLQSKTLELHLGNYKTKVNILHTSLPHKTLNLSHEKILQKGSYGSVFQARTNEQTYAVKIIQIIENSHFLNSIYKQYFLNLIASLLCLGPKIKKSFGYDIVIFKQSVLFSMELCEKLDFQQHQKIQKDTIQNLKILHSLNIIHSDIKPQNIMFSPTFNKYVFVDFGLSKIIQNPIGFETLTVFSGTLKYSSSQMRKTYLCQSALYVDLYYNDAICLQRSLKQLYSSYNSNLIEIYDEGQENPNHQSQLNQILSIVLLKYYVYKQEIDKIVSYTNKIKNMPLTLCEILNYSSKIQSSIVAQTTQFARFEKNQIILGKKIANNIDKLLSIYFNSDFIENSKSQKILLSEYLHFNNIQFKKCLKSPQFILKLFVFFNFLNETLNQENCIKKAKKSKLVINKVFQTQFGGEYIITRLKAIHVMRFFIKISRQLKIYKFYILLDSCLFYQEIYNYCLKYKDPLIFFLKATEFCLFWDIIYQNFPHQRFKQMRKLIEQKQIDNKCLKQNNLKLLAIKTVNRQRSSSCYENDEDQKELSKLIDKNLKLFHQKHITDNLFVIKYLHFDYRKLYLFEDKWLIDNNSLRIYSNYLYTFFKFETVAHFKCWEKFFTYIFSEEPSKQIKTKNFLNCKNTIQCQFYINKNKIELISEYFWCSVGSTCISYRQLLNQIMQYFRKSSTKFSQNEFNQHKTYSFLLFISYLLRYTLQNVQYTQQCERISKCQADQYILYLQNFTVLIQQQLKEKFEIILQQKSPACFILCETNKNLIKYYRQVPLSQTWNHLNKIINFILPLIGKVERSLAMLFNHIFWLQEELPCSQPNELIYSIVLKTCEYYLVSKNFYLLENREDILIHYIKFNNKNLHYDLSLKMILTLLQMRDESKRVTLSLHVYVVLKTIKYFCTDNIPIQVLKGIYSQLLFEKRKIQQSTFAFFRFTIFLMVHRFIDKKDKSKQIRKTALSVPFMIPNYSTKLKFKLLQIAKQIQQFKSKRKQIIFLRKLLKYQVQSCINPESWRIFVIIQQKIQFQQVFTPLYKKFKAVY